MIVPVGGEEHQVLLLLTKHGGKFSSERKRTLPVRAPPGSPRLEGRVDLMSDSVPELSIIIPSFNEELRLPATLEKIARYHRGGEKEMPKLSWWTTDPRIALPKWPSLFKGKSRICGCWRRHEFGQGL